MSHWNLPVWLVCRHGRLAWVLAGLALVLVLPAYADSLEPRAPAGHCRSAASTLLAQESPDQPWRSVGEGEEVHSRDLLLALPGMQALIEPRPESVELSLRGNLPALSSFAGLESAVVLHDSRFYDVDFTLLRGRVILTNRKAQGPARAWVRLLDSASEILLAEPGDAVALEIFGRWPHGVPFSREVRERPTTSLVFWALKGQADLKVGAVRHRLAAPPGPAYFHWGSVTGPDAGPQRRDSLPAWADPDAKAPAAAGLITTIADTFRASATRKGPDAALADLLAQADAGDPQTARLRQEFAVYGLAALGDLERVAEGLADPRQPHVRDAAIIALRHWIGETIGRDQQLAQLLVDRLNYSRAQAETVLHLLHSPFAEDQPETYDTLIAYLRHSKLAVRALAQWHLARLVDPEKVVPYDPAASDEDRARAADAWKKLIPSGNLPPRKEKQ
jgi:hypothetical protein